MASKGMYKRGATWWARVWVPSRNAEHRQSLCTTDEQAAEKAFAALKAEFEEHDGAAPSWKEAMVNWGDLVYSAKHDEDGLKASTREGYREILVAVSSQWKDLRLSEIGAKAIGEWVKLRKKGFRYIDQEGVEHEMRPCTNATARRSLTAISSVFRAAVAAGLTSTNPTLTWDRKIIPEKKRFIIPPLPEEIEVVLSYAHRNLRRALEVANGTGMRKQEVARLQWRDVKLNDGYILLQPQTKARRPRVVRLVTPGGDAYRTLSRTPSHITAQWVFWHSEGRPYADLTNSFKDVMERAVREEREAGRELRPFRLHDLRHAFAVRWLLEGGDIYELSKHLGHTSVKTTEANYLCMIEDYAERAKAFRGRNSHIQPHNSVGSNVVALPGAAVKTA